MAQHASHVGQAVDAGEGHGRGIEAGVAEHAPVLRPVERDTAPGRIDTSPVETAPRRLDDVT